MDAKREDQIKHVIVLRAGDVVPVSINPDTAVVVAGPDAVAGNDQIQKLAAVGARTALFVGDPQANEADQQALAEMIAELFPSAQLSEQLK